MTLRPLVTREQLAVFCFIKAQERAKRSTQQLAIVPMTLNSAVVALSGAARYVGSLTWWCMRYLFVVNPFKLYPST